MGQINQSVGVSPLIIIPGNQFHEVVIEGNACLHVEDGASVVMDEVRADDLISSPSQDSLQGSFSGLLDSSDDIVILGGLIESAGEIH